MNLPIEKAYDIAKKHISEIRTVREWADKMGYSHRDDFSHHFRKKFGKRPKQELVKIRLSCIDNEFQEKPDAKHFIIAKSVGLEDERGLFKFLKYHTELNPSEYKQNVLLMS